MRKSDITIQSGETSRLKILELSGDPQAIAERLAAWITARLPHDPPAVDTGVRET